MKRPAGIRVEPGHFMHDLSKLSVLPTVIRLAGGRNLLGSEQRKCFTAGANGAIVGNLLTNVGNTLSEDIAMFKALGFALQSQKE